MPQSKDVRVQRIADVEVDGNLEKLLEFVPSAHIAVVDSVTDLLLEKPAVSKLHGCEVHVVLVLINHQQHSFSH